MANNTIVQSVGQVTCGVLGTGSILNMGVAASQVLKRKSGRFVVGAGSGYVQCATATATDIMGWVIGTKEETASSTAGATAWDIETDIFTKLFVMPACKDGAAAVTAAELLAAIGYTVDIQMVSTNYQYADLGASAVDILLVYGYIYEGSAAGQQYAIVKPNVAKLAYTTHTDA